MCPSAWVGRALHAHHDAQTGWTNTARLLVLTAARKHQAVLSKFIVTLHQRDQANYLFIGEWNMTTWQRFKIWCQCTLKLSPFRDQTWYDADQMKWPSLFFVMLAHLSLDKMGAILQTIFSNAISWTKSFVFQFKFHWSLFPRVQLTITRPRHWFRWWLGATSHYLNQC